MADWGLSVELGDHLADDLCHLVSLKGGIAFCVRYLSREVLD